jgi:hypothetical protein
MKVYLAKFTLDGKVAYKIGHTKWFQAIKRFNDEQYNIFNNIEILDDIYIQREDAREARQTVEMIEKWLQCFFRKNFYLEEYFNKPSKTFDGLSGITEMFILPEGMSESFITSVFSNVKKHVKENYNG